MRRNIALLLLLSLIFTACGQGGSPGDGGTPPGGDGPPPGGPGSLNCRETVTGNITSATTWRNGPEECDYYVPASESATSRRNLMVTAELNVEPGTVIVFGEDVRVSVTDGGSILAEGSVDQPITLTGESATHGYWHGLCFGDNRESRLDFVRVQWAGAAWTGGHSLCNGAVAGMAGDGHEPVHITNSLLYGARTSGLSAHGLRLGEFRNNVLANNQEYAARVSSANVSRLGDGDYSGASLGEPNGLPYVHVSRLHDTPRGLETWRNLNVPYRLDRSDPAYNSVAGITDGVEVELEAGTTFVVADGTGSTLFWVTDGASLRALGSEAEPIIFRAEQEEPGHWNGLYFSGAAGSVLQHVKVAWAGGPPAGLRTGAIYIHRPGGSGTIELNDVVVQGSSTCAVWASDAGEQRIEINRVGILDHNANFDHLCGPFAPAG